MHRNFCITGVSGYVGQLLAEKLARDANIKVIGIDLNPPRNLSHVKFYQKDIRDPGLADVLRSEAIDVLIHLAFYTLPEGDTRLAESVNVDGSQNVLDAAEKAGVKRFVLASSSAAYGSHSDNPVPMREDQELRANQYFYYSYHKALQEKMTQKFKQSNPETEVIILRPCPLIGPHINNPTGEALSQKVLFFFTGEQPAIQFIYEDDAAEAFYLAAIGEREGSYNIAADETLTQSEIAVLLDKKLILLPFGLLATLASLGKLIKLIPAGGTTLKFIRNPVIVDASKFNQHFNFKPQYNSKQALLKYSELT